MSQVNNYVQPVSASGVGDNGLANQLTVTRQGHLEVEIKAPVMPFGSVHVESMNILCQSDGVYGINAGQNSLFSRHGSNDLHICNK